MQKDGTGRNQRLDAVNAEASSPCQLKIEDCFRPRVKGTAQICSVIYTTKPAPENHDILNCTLFFAEIYIFHYLLSVLCSPLSCSSPYWKQGVVADIEELINLKV